VGVELGGLSQKGFESPSIEYLVVNRRWRFRCCFRSGHLKKEAKKRERKGENEGLEEDSKNPKKQTQSEKQRKCKVQKT